MLGGCKQTVTTSVDPSDAMWYTHQVRPTSATGGEFCATLPAHEGRDAPRLAAQPDEIERML
jgi:hypothetical protein